MKGPYTEPLHVVTKLPDSSQLSNSSDFDDQEDHVESAEKVITAGLKTQKLPSGPQTLISEPSQKWSNKISTVPELELRKLERGDVSVDRRGFHVRKRCSWFSCLFADFYLSSLSQLHSAEEQEQLLSCINSDPSNWGPREKKVTQTDRITHFYIIHPNFQTFQ